MNATSVFLQISNFGSHVTILARSVQPTLVSELPSQLGSGRSLSAADHLKQPNDLKFDLNDHSIWDAFSRNSVKHICHVDTSHSNLVMVSYFSCNERWFGFNIYILNTLFQLFANLRIITAATNVVLFCFQGQLWEHYFACAGYFYSGILKSMWCPVKVKNNCKCLFIFKFFNLTFRVSQQQWKLQNLKPSN